MYSSIKLFLKGCFVSEVSKDTPHAKLTRGFISSWCVFDSYSCPKSNSTSYSTATLVGVGAVYITNYKF
nr:MAG TPA: hypothetical protein [Caudoviricetes sp.]